MHVRPHLGHRTNAPLSTLTWANTVGPPQHYTSVGKYRSAGSVPAYALGHTVARCYASTGIEAAAQGSTGHGVGGG
eukprot:3344678-Rhodomonas_salina.1